MNEIIVALITGGVTLAVLALCGLAIVRRFEGALPYLTTLIGALQAVTDMVLGALIYERSTSWRI